jgi:hypothetical protein
MKRTITQIATTSMPSSDCHGPGFDVVALCDDGSVWVCDVAHREWFELPPIPDSDREEYNPFADIEGDK